MTCSAPGNPNNIPTRNKVMPQRAARRMRSCLGFPPVTFASYPLNHQQARPANTNTTKWVIMTVRIFIICSFAIPLYSFI